ncbi:MAG: hypothetical protein PHC34_03470 [Candidatus Gastranaerophilales bacterium]|nr:hypothetical protein [Candidatus Gastranaerophilales bacterium]
MKYLKDAEKANYDLILQQLIGKLDKSKVLVESAAQIHHSRFA